MHEKAKLAEAEHFLAVMSEDRDQPVRFRHALSAFLSAARSVLQYALEDAKLKAGGQSWYEGAVSTRPVVGFMKDQRDTNIHHAPLPLNNDVTVFISGVVAVGSVAGEIVGRPDGTTARVTSSGPPRPPTPPTPAVAATYTFRFPGWPKPHDVLTLCGEYLAELRNVVDDGLSAGFISG